MKPPKTGVRLKGKHYRHLESMSLSELIKLKALAEKCLSDFLRDPVMEFLRKCSSGPDRFEQNARHKVVLIQRVIDEKKTTT